MDYSNSRTRIIPAGMESDDEDYDLCSVLKTAKNLKISVVNDIHIGAGLNDQDFDISLPPEIQKWLEEFQRNWSIYKKTPAMVNSLNNLFLMSEQPHLMALKLFANCPGCDNIKTKNLAYFVLEAICNLKDNLQDISNKIDENLRMVAFNFVKTQGLPLMYKAVTEAYDLQKSRYMFVTKIRKLIEQHYYKDASHWAIYLDLIEIFNIYDIPLPLILQDKISFAEDYLDVAKHLQYPLVNLLDTFLDRKTSVMLSCDKLIGEYNYTDVRSEKLSSKPLTKLITRLAKKYQVPNDLTPNLIECKSYGYLQYLLHKKYIEKCMASDAWKELVRECVNSKELQNELVYFVCVAHSDLEEGLYWAKYYKIPMDELPLPLQDLISTLPHDDLCDDEDGLNASKSNFSKKGEEFYQLSIPRSSVILVNNQFCFNQMLNELKYETTIAFDSEWKPIFRGEVIVNLIQLASRSKIYLIDVLSQDFTDDLWKALSKTIFNNSDITKLGYALQHDLLMFQKALPILNINIQQSFLDLQDAWKKLREIKEFEFPFKAQNQGENLSTLVEICFGKKLDKSNQFSNWANRPLRRDQIIYAALDAHCLIEIYDLISLKLRSLNIDTNAFFEKIITEANCKLQKVKRKTNNIVVTHKKINDVGELQSPFLEPMRTCKVQFVCEEMLSGLAKSLRKLGIDCIVVHNSDDTADACIKIALYEKRFLLTKGIRFVKYLQYLPFGHCYKVKSDIVDEQLIEIIKFYNFLIYEEDVFSRCQLCNSNEFILCDKYDIKSIQTGKIYDCCLRKPIATLPPKRNFILKPVTLEIIQTKMTGKNQLIKINKIPDYVIDSINYFYICEGCGKCYWDGSHLDKVLNGHLKNYIKNKKTC